MALCFPSAPCLGLGIRNASCLHACLISIQSSFALAVCLSHQHTHSLALAVCLSRQHTTPHCLWFLLSAVPYQHTQSTFSNMLVPSACITTLPLATLVCCPISAHKTPSAACLSHQHASPFPWLDACLVSIPSSLPLAPSVCPIQHTSCPWQHACLVSMPNIGCMLAPSASILPSIFRGVTVGHYPTIES